LTSAEPVLAKLQLTLSSRSTVVEPVSRTMVVVPKE